MKKLVFYFLAIIFYPLFSTTSSDLSSRIVMDGFSNEFQPDEVMIVDSLGNSLESDQDSYWGEYNDIRQIKCTWDEENLYVAVDACSWDNNVILFIDIYDDYGITSLNDLNTWKRSFHFYNQNPDFFLATWDTNNNPQFWIMEESSEFTAIESANTTDAASFDTGNLNRSMEAVIPWKILYYGGENNERNLLNYPSIKLVALITSGSDNTSGPDAAPDNLGGMSNDSAQLLVIDNYVEVMVDLDGNGEPDMSVEPNSWDRISFYQVPPIKASALSIRKISFLNGKILNPYDDLNEFQISIDTNRDSEFYADIFDLNGKHIKRLVQEQTYLWNWDGRAKNGSVVPFGFYLVRIKAESGEVSKTEAFSVIK